MSYILYLNDFQISLKDSSEIAITKQVNDLARLDNRQTTFTKNIKIPKTSMNTEALDFLGTVGNDSSIVYSRIKCQLLDSNSGDFIIRNGWAVVNSSDDQFFNLAIYEGNINFYKSIANLKMSSLDLTDITHIRTLATITDSIINNLPYKYIIADYNGGATILGSTDINADYLIPSVKVSWLFNKVMEKIGFNYSGSIFTSQEFLDLWLTYPKGTTIGSGISNLFQSLASSVNYNSDNPPPNEILPINITSHNLISGSTALENGYVTYVFEGSEQSKVYIETISPFIGGNWTNDPDDPTSTFFTPINMLNLTTGDRSNTEMFVNPGDELMFFIATRGEEDFIFGNGIFNLKVDESEKIDFKRAFENLSITDFINEVLWFFGLTPVFDAYSNSIKFSTIEERVKTNQVEDWSDKFSKVITEKYIFGSYAKVNMFRHKYNESNADYNDVSFVIGNENLKESNTLIQSKFYTYEFAKEIEIAGKKLNTYKLWNKEVNDGVGVPFKYKALDNRFYFIKYIDTVVPETIIQSEANGDSGSFTSLPIERNDGLSFKKIKNNHYTYLGYLVNKCKIYECEILLNPYKVATFDFSKIIHLEQLGSNFIVNRIINFVKNKITKVELIKIDSTSLLQDLVPVVPPSEFPIELQHIINVSQTIPDYGVQGISNPYEFNITALLETDIVLDINEVIQSFEFQGYSGNTISGNGLDIIQNSGVIQWGEVANLHPINIDYTYDWHNPNRTLIYIYYVYVLNTVTNIAYHKYTVSKTFNIVIVENINIQVQTDAQVQQEIINVLLSRDLPLHPNETYSHIIVTEFVQGDNSPSEFLTEGNLGGPFVLGNPVYFVNTMELYPQKIDGSFTNNIGHALEIKYDLYAINTVTNVTRLVHSNIYVQWIFQ